MTYAERYAEKIGKECKAINKRMAQLRAKSKGTEQANA